MGCCRLHQHQIAWQWDGFRVPFYHHLPLACHKCNLQWSTFWLLYGKQNVDHPPPYLTAGMGSSNVEVQDLPFALQGSWGMCNYSWCWFSTPSHGGAILVGGVTAQRCRTIWCHRLVTLLHCLGSDAIRVQDMADVCSLFTLVHK